MDHHFSASLRWVDINLERPRWRSTLSYRVHPRLQLGVELNPAADEIGPLATWFLLIESAGRTAHWEARDLVMETFDHRPWLYFMRAEGLRDEWLEELQAQAVDL